MLFACKYACNYDMINRTVASHLKFKNTIMRLISLNSAKKRGNHFFGVNPIFRRGYL